jgi:branched-chain amino acid aminotransferase
MADLSQSLAYFRDDFVPFEEAKLSIASAPVLYGLSVYSVIPVFKNSLDQSLALFRMHDHYIRMQNSARIMAFDDFLNEWDEVTFTGIIMDLLKKNKISEDSLVRASIFVDDILKGTRMKGLKHSFSAFVYDMTPFLPPTGASLMVSSWSKNIDNALPARAKVNGSYVNAALMKHEAITSGYDDAVALDGHGHVTESTVANIFIVRKGQLLTPGNSTDLLEGITRDTIGEFARELGVSYKQRTIDRSELYIADEVFLCGSSMNIVPVTSVDHRKIGNGKVGELTKKFQSMYADTVHQKSPAPAGWLTPVA